MAGKFHTHWFDHIFCCTLRRFTHSPERILVDFVKPGMTVLDIGFGNGYFSLGMARMVGSSGHVISVETDYEKIKSLKRLAVDSGLDERIDPRICSDSSLAIDDLTDKIDFSLAFFVIHHAADMTALMSETQKALKPEGRFLIVEPSHHASAGYCESVEKAAQHAGLTVAYHPKIIRTWAVLLVKNRLS